MELLFLIGSVPWSCCFSLEASHGNVSVPFLFIHERIDCGCSLEASHGVVVAHWKRLNRGLKEGCPSKSWTFAIK